ncbi:MAG: hypothetical protein IKK42_08895 [Oscillospiraceae bacterium]|nr:hypothetical protein [Oscillospiraceae bacterium]
MNKYENLDSLLCSCETAKIYFASQPDYVRGAVVKNSTNIRTEDDLHRIAEETRNEFN